MGGVGGEGKGSSAVMSRSRKLMDDALPTKHSQGGKDDLYTELWRACAGPLVYVPRAGDFVYYFLQGHIEQVEVYATQDGKMELPIYNLPPKILCEVVYVQLKAEDSTDEVFAQITLLPTPKQDEPSLEDGNSEPFPPKANVWSFSKKLTPSDTSTHGGFSVPKRHADECLPPLDMAQDTPLQQLVAKDLHGFIWHFRHIYRGQPKRHLLTSGWSVFVTSKKLVAGDACVFLRGENGELRVGVHRTMKLQNNGSASVISGHTMQHGILANAFHAISTGTRFTVYYRPWTSPAEFIIPFDQYLSSTKIDYSIGTRFEMAFEGEECAEHRIAGTVVGTEAIDHIRWPASEWRCLKVRWDATSDTLIRPTRVSPWNIEPIECNKKLASGQHKQKRLRSIDASSLGFSSLVGNVSLPGGIIVNSSLRNKNWPAPLASYGVHDNAILSRNFSVLNASSLNSTCQEWRASELKDENETPCAEPNGGNRYMLFGVNLVKSPPELPSPQVPSSNKLESFCSVLPTSQSSVSESGQVSELSKSVSGIPLEKQCKNCCVSRSCTKVLKFGAALGRSVDLTRFHGYDELIRELDHMFDFEGSLIDGGSGWHIAYKDDEGDIMLIGDYPWQEFQCTVRRMFICPKEDIDKLNPSSPDQTPSN